MEAIEELLPEQDQNAAKSATPAPPRKLSPAIC
jgi:hypothetical protein